MKNPKHILITGASSGIGQALAFYYAAEGVTLYVTGRNEERLEAVKLSCEEKGAAVKSACVSVTDKAAMQRFIHEAWEETGLDLVIANAGISAGSGGRGETDDQTYLLFETNVKGVLHTVLPAVDFMKEKGRGQIALLSSLAGYRGLPSAPAYCGSKAAVKVWGEGMRGLLAPLGVEVSVVCPGFVRSRITDRNTFPMPFFLEADEAAARIAKGLERNKGRITFPWPMAFALWCVAAMPDGLMDLIGRLLPKKKDLG